MATLSHKITLPPTLVHCFAIFSIINHYRYHFKYIIKGIEYNSIKNKYFLNQGNEFDL